MAKKKTDVPVMVDQTQKQLDELQARFNEQEQELNEALAVNAKLVLEIERLTSAGPAKVEAHSVNLGTFKFEFEGQPYGFAYSKGSYKGQVITPVEICADAGLQAELIAKNSSMIKKL